MNLAKIAIEKKAVSYFITFLLVVGGLASFFSLGQLEDPEFSIKTAVIATKYPGASAAEVELEVTDRIEIALQQLKTIDYLKSFSAPGFSQIWVNIKPEYWSDRLPQVWDGCGARSARSKPRCRLDANGRWSMMISVMCTDCCWPLRVTVSLMLKWKPRPRI